MFGWVGGEGTDDVAACGFACHGDLIEGGGGEVRVDGGEGGWEGGVQPGEEVLHVGEDVGDGGFGDVAVVRAEDDGVGGGGQVEEPARGCW